MKLTLENLETLRTHHSVSLRDDVIDHIVDNWEDYDTKSDIFLDILTLGCKSGIVPSLIYYSDTSAFYEKHKSAIGDMLYEEMVNTGLSIDKLFANWEAFDPLALLPYNRNILAWFGFEEMTRRIANQFEELEDLI